MMPKLKVRRMRLEDLFRCHYWSVAHLGFCKGGKQPLVTFGCIVANLIHFGLTMGRIVMKLNR